MVHSRNKWQVLRLVLEVINTVLDLYISVMVSSVSA